MCGTSVFIILSLSGNPVEVGKFFYIIKACHSKTSNVMKRYFILFLPTGSMRPTNAVKGPQNASDVHRVMKTCTKSIY